MLAYAARRVLIGCLTLLAISFIVYGLIRAMPGDPTAVFSSPGAVLTEEQVAEMRRSFGLDRPWTAAYLEWLSRIARGNLGTSLARGEPVARSILEAMGPTLLLSATSLGLAYLLSVPLGVHAARRAGRPDDWLLGGALYALYSVPSYVVATVLILVFGAKLGWLPLSRMGGDEEGASALSRALDVGRHMLLPVVCYTYGYLAYFTRFVRAAMLEVLQEDYVRTARAKGLPERIVLWRHAFRNALVPCLNLVGLSLPALLGGSVILERIFAWPGMGRLFFEALDGRDYTLLMGLAMTFSLLTVLGTLIADLLCAAADPRIAYARIAYSGGKT